MSEGKYAEELHRRVCAIPDSVGTDHAELVKIANEVAREHPVQYEGFRIRSAIINAWRRLWKR